MPEEVLFKSESPQSREAIASYLRSVADKLESGDAVTLTAGEQSVTMNPPAKPTFEVKAEREGPADSPGQPRCEGLVGGRRQRRIPGASTERRPGVVTVPRKMRCQQSSRQSESAVRVRRRVRNQ